MAFAIQRVLPTSPIYRGPNPTHIEVQICSHKGSKALPTSQRTLAFALDQTSGTQQLDILAIRTSSLSNWTLWLSAQDFPVVTPENRATGHSSYPHKCPQLPNQGYMRNRTMACIFISTPSKRAGFQPVRKWIGSEKVSMILPQVHLRKPCYDFSFL